MRNVSRFLNDPARLSACGVSELLGLAKVPTSTMVLETKHKRTACAESQAAVGGTLNREGHLVQADHGAGRSGAY